VIKGSCVCGNVKYEADDELREVSHCHCTTCRKIHGTAFASWGAVARDKFLIRSGLGSLISYAFSEQLERLFCARCGSPVFADYKAEPNTIYLVLGSVDGELKCPPAYHEFTKSKAPWFTITDDLPQYKEFWEE